MTRTDFVAAARKAFAKARPGLTVAQLDKLAARAAEHAFASSFVDDDISPSIHTFEPGVLLAGMLVDAVLDLAPDNEKTPPPTAAELAALARQRPANQEEKDNPLIGIRRAQALAADPDAALQSVDLAQLQQLRKTRGTPTTAAPVIADNGQPLPDLARVARVFATTPEKVLPSQIRTVMDADARAAKGKAPPPASLAVKQAPAPGDRLASPTERINQHRRALAAAKHSQ